MVLDATLVCTQYLSQCRRVDYSESCSGLRQIFVEVLNVCSSNFDGRVSAHADDFSTGENPPVGQKSSCLLV